MAYFDYLFRFLRWKRMERPHLSARDRFMAAMTLSMLSVFVALPLGLPLLGVSPINSLAVAILALGALADAYTTKFGFRVGGTEMNPLYKLTGGHLGQNRFLVLVSSIKMSMGLALLAVLPNPYLLLLIALYSMSGVLFNSVGLAFSSR